MKDYQISRKQNTDAYVAFTDKRFNRISGHAHLWMLKAALDPATDVTLKA